VPHSIVAVSSLDDYHPSLTIRPTPTKMLSRESFSEEFVPAYAQPDVRS